MVSLYPVSKERLVSVCAGGFSPPPVKLPTGGVAWLILTPVTLPATFSSVLIYWKKPLPCTISSLPSTQELFSLTVSSVKGSLSGNHWKAAQVKGEFSKFQKLWIAALLFNSSVTLKSVTNTKEKDMETHSSILSWKSHGQRSPVGYSPWVTSQKPPNQLSMGTGICLDIL